MITLNDCISLLDENAESPACVRFLSLAAKPAKLKKRGGFRATYELKADGINVHLEYIERAWRVLALQFYGVKESGFSCFAGEFESALDTKTKRGRLHEVLGAPSSTGGDGKVGKYGIVDRWWDRWDREKYSLRFDFEADAASIYVVSLQRPRDVQEFETRRKATIRG